MAAFGSLQVWWLVGAECDGCVVGLLEVGPLESLEMSNT